MWSDFEEHDSSPLDSPYMMGTSVTPAEHYLPDIRNNGVGPDLLREANPPNSTINSNMEIEDTVLSWSRPLYIVSHTNQAINLRSPIHMASNLQSTGYEMSQRELRPISPANPSGHNISSASGAIAPQISRKHNRDGWMVNDTEPFPMAVATDSKTQLRSLNSGQTLHVRRSREANKKKRLRNERGKIPIVGVCSDTQKTPSGGYRVRRRINYMPRPSAPHWASYTIANRLIHRARVRLAIDERALQCLYCGLLPNLPVTGKCGHTRCLRCLQSCLMCPCGADSPWSPHVNILVQDLVEKLLATNTALRACMTSLIDDMEFNATDEELDNEVATISGVQETSQPSPDAGAVCRIPISSQARYKYAHGLMITGQLRKAAPHLAQVAASTEECCSLAVRNELTQAVETMSRNGDPRQLEQELREAVDSQSTSTWLKARDLECILCCETFTKPVTTPCGHTYCRTCLERSLDYRDTCALCMGSLINFDLSTTNETEVVCSALMSIGELKSSLEPDPHVIPIFTCTVAYPGMPCPLFVFDRRYWLMIRRVLKSCSRKFGMVACEQGGTYSNYGTILEVRDCVHLQSGCSILSTIGVSRFRVEERGIWDGFDVARIQPIVDIIDDGHCLVWELRLLAAEISNKATIWINSMHSSLRTKIESAFGMMPFIDLDEEWWLTVEGPTWLWWLVAILPLRTEIKVLILATDNLYKRMRAVSVTLDNVLRMVITNPPDHVREYHIALNDSWLQRNL